MNTTVTHENVKWVKGWPRGQNLRWKTIHPQNNEPDWLFQQFWHFFFAQSTRKWATHTFLSITHRIPKKPKADPNKQQPPLSGKHVTVKQSTSASAEPILGPVPKACCNMFISQIQNTQNQYISINFNMTRVKQVTRRYCVDMTRSTVLLRGHYGHYTKY